MRKTLFLVLATCCLAGRAAAQRVTGVSAGVDTTTASLIVTLQPMQTIQQAFTVRVIFGPPAILRIYRGARMLNGVKIGVPLDSLLVGDTGCLYAVVTDRLGNEEPGLGPVTYTSSNPAVMALSSGGNCPTMTVRTADIPLIP